MDQVVELFWRATGEAPSGRQTAMPTGAMGLIAPLGGGVARWWGGSDGSEEHAHPGLTIVGAQDSRIILDGAQLGDVLGVDFKPGAAAALFGAAAQTFRNTHAPLEDLWGAGARRLHDALCSAASSAEMFRIMEAALLARLRLDCEPDRRVAHAVARLRATHGGALIGELASEVDLPAKTFIARFEADVGLTPKLYGRLRRFRSVLETVHRLDTIRWTDVAMACGYYDQPHFIRDFRDFCGFTPSQYARLRGPQINHLDLPADGEFSTSAS